MPTEGAIDWSNVESELFPGEELKEVVEELIIKERVVPRFPCHDIEEHIASDVVDSQTIQPVAKPRADRRRKEIPVIPIEDQIIQVTSINQSLPEVDLTDFATNLLNQPGIIKKPSELKEAVEELIIKERVIPKCDVSEEIEVKEVIEKVDKPKDDSWKRKKKPKTTLTEEVEEHEEITKTNVTPILPVMDWSLVASDLHDKSKSVVSSLVLEVPEPTVTVEEQLKASEPEKIEEPVKVEEVAQIVASEPTKVEEIKKPAYAGLPVDQSTDAWMDNMDEPMVFSDEEESTSTQTVTTTTVTTTVTEVSEPEKVVESVKVEEISEPKKVEEPVKVEEPKKPAYAGLPVDQSTDAWMDNMDEPMVFSDEEESTSTQTVTTTTVTTTVTEVSEPEKVVESVKVEEMSEPKKVEEPVKVEEVPKANVEDYTTTTITTVTTTTNPTEDIMWTAIVKEQPSVDIEQFIQSERENVSEVPKALPADPEVKKSTKAKDDSWKRKKKEKKQKCPEDIEPKIEEPCKATPTIQPTPVMNWSAIATELHKKPEETVTVTKVKEVSVNKIPTEHKSFVESEQKHTEESFIKPVGSSSTIPIEPEQPVVAEEILPVVKTEITTTVVTEEFIPRWSSMVEEEIEPDTFEIEVDSFDNIRDILENQNVNLSWTHEVEKDKEQERLHFEQRKLEKRTKKKHEHENIPVDTVSIEKKTSPAPSAWSLHESYAEVVRKTGIPSNQRVYLHEEPIQEEPQKEVHDIIEPEPVQTVSKPEPMKRQRKPKIEKRIEEVVPEPMKKQRKPKVEEPILEPVEVLQDTAMEIIEEQPAKSWSEITEEQFVEEKTDSEPLPIVGTFSWSTIVKHNVSEPSTKFSVITEDVQEKTVEKKSKQKKKPQKHIPETDQEPQHLVFKKEDHSQKKFKPSEEIIEPIVAQETEPVVYQESVLVEVPRDDHLTDFIQQERKYVDSLPKSSGMSWSSIVRTDLPEAPQVLRVVEETVVERLVPQPKHNKQKKSKKHDEIQLNIEEHVVKSPKQKRKQKHLKEEPVILETKAPVSVITRVVKEDLQPQETVTVTVEQLPDVQELEVKEQTLSFIEGEKYVPEKSSITVTKTITTVTKDEISEPVTVIEELVEPKKVEPEVTESSTITTTTTTTITTTEDVSEPEKIVILKSSEEPDNFDEMNKRVDDLLSRIKKLPKEIEQIKSTINVEPQQIDDTPERVSELNKRVDELLAKIKKLPKQEKMEITSHITANSANDEIEELNKKVDQLLAKIQKLPKQCESSTTFVEDSTAPVVESVTTIVEESVAPVEDSFVVVQPEEVNEVKQDMLNWNMYSDFTFWQDKPKYNEAELLWQIQKPAESQPEIVVPTTTTLSENLSIDTLPQTFTNVESTNLLENISKDSFPQNFNNIETQWVLSSADDKPSQKTESFVEKTEESRVNIPSLAYNLLMDSSLPKAFFDYKTYELQYQLHLANELKKVVTNVILPTLTKTDDKPDDDDKDPGSGSSGNSTPTPDSEPKTTQNMNCSSQYMSTDLPAGIGHWRDQSTYLAVEAANNASITNPEHKPEEATVTTKTTTVTTTTTTASTENSSGANQPHQKKELSQEIDELLQSLSSVADGIANLPSSSLESMLHALKLIQQNLEDYRKEANRLKQISQNVPTDPQTERLINESIDRIDLLTLRSQQGTQMIENAMVSHRKRQDELDNYQTHLKEIEVWLQGALIELKDVEQLPRTEAELQTLLESSQVLLKNLKEKEESLANLLESTHQLQHHEDVAELAKPLSEQLQQIISILREQITIITTRIYTIETRISEATQTSRPKTVTFVESEPESLDDRTIDSVSMPEEEVKPMGYTVETQTSLHQSEIEQQTSFPLEHKVVDTIDSSAQTTKERKPTENILVTQKIQDGHETIQIDTIPNVEIPDVPEDVLIEARYHQKPQGDVSRSTELVIKNVPESFETTFVEPDETTTEVVVDADGTKRIIVKKITKSRHQVTQRTQQQQISTISTLVGEGEEPQLQSVQVVNFENRETILSGDDDGVHKTVITQQSKGSVAQGSGPDTVIIEEFESAPIVQEFVQERPEGVEYQGVPVHEGDVTYITEGGESTIRAVVQQVTRKIIKKTRKIIKRVVVIDGVEHITEEVVEEPEEIEITEEEMAPNVNVSIIRTVNGQVVTEEEYNRLMAEAQPQEQVFEIPQPQPAQVDLLKSFDKAPVDVTITEVDTRTSTPLSTPSNVTDNTIEVRQIVTTIIDDLQDKVLQNIEDIWPKEHHLQPSEIEHSEPKGVIEVLPTQTYKEEIWPVNIATGSNVDLKHYTFEAQPQEQQAPVVEDVIVKEVSSKPVIVGFEKKPVTEEKVELKTTTTSEAQELFKPEEVKEPQVPEASSPTKTATITITTTEEQLSARPDEKKEQPIVLTTEEIKSSEEKELKPEEAKPKEPEKATITITTTSTEQHLIEQPLAEVTEPHSIDTETYSISEPSFPEDKLLKDVPTSKQQTDIRTATQLFISGESVGPKVITVTAPSVEDNGDSTLKVTMAPTDKTRVNVNIIESTVTETERDDTSRSEIELDTKRNRKKKKRKEKEEVLPQQQSEEELPKEIPQEKSHSISEVETPQETGYEPEDKTLDETDVDDTKKKRKKKKKQKFKAKEDEDSHVPVSSKDSDLDTTLSIESEGKVHQEDVTEISPESELGSLSEATTVKVVEESVISPDSDSLQEPNKELLMPKEVVEVTYVEDVEQQTTPRTEDPKEIAPVVEPKELKSAQTSPVHIPIGNISQQTSIEVPDLTDVESQTIIIESTDADIQTTPRPEPKVVTDEIARVIPDVDVAIQEVPDLTDSSMQIVVESKETGQQTTPRQTEPTITSADVVSPLVVDIVQDIVRDIKEPTTDQTTHTETVEMTQTYVQTSPREEEVATVVRDVVPTKEQETTTDIVKTVESDVQTLPFEEKEEKEETSLTISEPYNLDIHATVAIPPDSECPAAEPIVYHYTQTVELPKKQKRKKGKKDPEEQKKSDAEVNINVEIDKHGCMVPVSQTDSKKPPLATLTIQRTTTTTTFPENEPVVEEEVKSQVVKQKQRSRPTSTVMIEEVMSPTEEIDVPLTPGAAPESPTKLWSIPKSDDIIVTQTTTHHEYPVHDVVEVINDSLRQLESDEKPTELTNILQLATIGEYIVEEPLENRIQEINESIGQLEDAIKRGDTTIITTTVVTVVEKVSTWLKTIEYRVYLIRQQSNEGPSEKKVDDYSKLNDEINLIKQNVVNLEANVDKIPEQEQLNLYVTKLKSYVTAVEGAAKDRQNQEIKDLERWNEFLITIYNITTIINNSNDRYDNIVSLESPLDNKIAALEQLENENLDTQANVHKILNRAHSIQRDFPGKEAEIPEDIYNALDVCRNLQNNIIQERDRLFQLQSLSEEYEQTLKEFANITVIADKLVESPIVCKNLDELHAAIQKHRKFFVNLNYCRDLLESLQRNIDVGTREKHHNLHKELYGRATTLLNKATDRAQKLAQAASKWSILDKGMKDERQWLQVAHQRVPDLSTVTSADFEQYAHLYTSLNTDIAHHHAKMTQLSNTAEKVQDLVEAPQLVEESNESLITLLKLQEDVASYLHRLLRFKEIWTLYEGQTEKLETFIRNSEKELQQIHIPDDPRAQPIEHIRQFWEVKAQFEMHNNLRGDIANSLEKSLEIIPLADEMLQRQFYGQLEDRWTGIAGQISSIEGAILNGISSDDLPQSEKLQFLERELKEIYLSMTGMKGVIKSEDDLLLYIERIQVLNKRVALINNELGRIGIQDESEPEKIGELFALSSKITNHISEELENSTVLRDQLLSLKEGIDAVRKDQARMSVTLDECEQCENKEKGIVEAAATDCQQVAEELIASWQEIMRLRQLLHTLPLRLKMTVSPTKLEREIAKLQDEHAFLETRCTNILTILGNRLTVWKRYEKQLDMVHDSVNEAGFMMELLKIQGNVDYERLKKATERLEGLSSELQSRENLIDDLKTSAKPLVDTCDGDIVEQIESAVQGACVAWNDTTDNLQTLCTKYQKAVELWQKYQKASATVKHWIEQQMETLDTLNLHSAHHQRPPTQKSASETLEHVKVCENNLNDQNDKLNELRELVSKIASNVGLDASHMFQGELDALGNRLKEVKDGITTLADVAENQEKEHIEFDENLNEARVYLKTVQQDLSAKPTNQKESEQQLVALRDHLSTLTKTEEQLKDLQSRPHSDTSIIEVLTLWQRIFKDTFQEYHRLSSRLVKGQNSSEALKLWKQYLDHVQSFLNVQIPENYSSLKEHRHLCEIHRNLLAQQQQMYLGQPVDEAVADQFKNLTDLHNETLTKIVGRNSEIENRIELWSAYRLDLQQLLDWLKDREAEKSRLQLRYIHLKRVSHLKQRIDHILTQLPSGKQMTMNIKDQQDALFKFCDDSLAASVRMEHASAQQRISNLESALQIWRDFLSKISNLNQRYMEIRSRLSREFDDVQNLINDTSLHLPTNAAAMDEMIRILQNQRIRISGVSQDLEEMNVIQEELKECISPHDMKPIRRNVWSLWQQQSDLDMQLITLINTMEDRASLHKVFNSRFDRVQLWMTNLEKRIEKDVDLTLRASQNPEEAVKAFEKEINSDMNLREKEREWLLSSGRELISLYEDNPEYRDDVQSKLNALIDQWERLKYITKLKSNKIKDLRMTLLRLEERMSLIRQWMFKIETELAKPIVLESHAPAVIEGKIKEVDQIQRSIKNESSNVGEVFNLCEMLLNDADAWKTHFNTANLSSNVKNLERRWVDVCKSADKRKRHIITIWNLLQTVIKITTENKNWLAKQETEVSALERDLKKLSREDIQKRIDDVMSKIKEVESQEPNYKQLEQAYAKLAMAESLDQENIQKLTMPTKVMLMKWRSLVPRCNAIIDTLSLEMKLYRTFTTNQSKVVSTLADIESDLTKIQNESGDPNEQMKKLEKLERKFKQAEEALKEADNSGNAAKDKLTKENVAKILLLIREYTTMWQEIQTRIVTVKKELIQRVAVASAAAAEAVIDASTHVNVMAKKSNRGELNRMTSITPKDAYSMELTTAIQECKDHLDEFQKVIADKLRKPGPQRIQKLTTSCSSSVELMRHLSNLLVTECSATPKEAEVETVNDLTLRYETLLSQWKARQQHEEKTSEVGRLTCPLCTQRNWQQIDNDLWRLEQWLQFAESTQTSQVTPPTDIELLEDVAQDQREFLLDLESHKSIIASLNVVGDHLATHTLDTDKAKQLRARLEQNNERWNQVCINATTWQSLLQTALMGNKEFHNIIDELCGWLQETEQNIKASEPVDLTEDRSVLEVKFRRFKELRAELERCEPRVVSLQDAADQLLKSSGGDEDDGSTNTYTRTLSRLTDLRLRLQSLRRLSGIYIVKLGAVLGYDGDKLGTHGELLDPSGSRIQATSSAATQSTLHTDNANTEDAVNGDAINTTVLARGYRFLGRVVRASLPIQALMLLLLGVATLVPHGDEYSCMFSNTFARSLEPMLTYPNGPPPT
ncbi:hypothetical protein ACFFRR_003963 [Megaselia abdita]